jgi:hypothetical protein
MAILQKFSAHLGQARELSLLIELEACWENLRVDQPTTAEHVLSLKELQHKQKAYEAFRVKLVAYNKVYRPAYVPEMLLNTADRLSAWCQSMIALHLAVQDDPQACCPTHLLERAYRWANRLSDKMKTGRIARPSPSRTISAAILELQDVAQWCASLSASERAG